MREYLNLGTEEMRGEEVKFTREREVYSEIDDLLAEMMHGFMYISENMSPSLNPGA